VNRLWQDLRFGLRMFLKSPGFTVVAILTLALGIGASTSIFSVIDNILLEPFPYKDAGRLMGFNIHDLDRNERGGRTVFTPPEFLEYSAQNHVFDGMIGMHQIDVLYSSGGGTERFLGMDVTPGTFEFLGMGAMLGRVLQPSDYKPGAPPVFVMRYRVWASRFGADPKLINQVFVLNDVPRTLVGVMPPRFAWGDADVWIPTWLSRAPVTVAGAFPDYYFVLGRLKPDATRKQAAADLDVVAHRLAVEFPKEYPKHFNVEIASLADGVVGQFRATLFIVLAAVGLLLLIGCGNVANLLLVRATAREREFAVRAAIGAGRWRLARQLLIESLLLAVFGALCGSLLAWGGLKALVSAIPKDTIPAEAVIRINGPVLLFTLAVAMLTALVFGLAPVLHVARRDLNEALRDAGRGAVSGSAHARLRNAVVVLEVALSLTLLVGAGLLMKSFVATRDVKLGMQPDHILVARLPLPHDRYKTAAQLQGFYRPLLARLKALPGVVDATETSTLPPYGGIRSNVDIPGKVHDEKWTALFQLCSEGYFSVLRVPLLEGRFMTEAEVNDARKVAVVNQEFVKKYFGTENPIGQKFRLAFLETIPDPIKDPWFEIVGVSGNVKNQGLRDPIMPEVWIPYTTTGAGERGILVRTSQDPLSMLKPVRDAIWATDHNVALTLTGSLEGFIQQYSLAAPRFGFLMMTIFACIGMILVTIGVYSVIAYTTARRTQEIGIRMALGAEGSNILRLVLGSGLRLVGLGVAIGIAASLGVGRLISSELWGVSAHDPATLAMVSGGLLAIGAAACWFPARRATRVDPMSALRYE
jgi:putative ABC transport system permease protein